MPIDYIHISEILEVPDQGKKFAKIEIQNTLSLGTWKWTSGTPLLPIYVVSEENGIVSMISLQKSYDGTKVSIVGMQVTAGGCLDIETHRL